MDPPRTPPASRPGRPSVGAAGGWLGSRSGWCWAAASLALWPAGWLVTTVAGVQVEQHYAVFGARGALVHAALGAAVLHRLLPRPGRSARR